MLKFQQYTRTFNYILNLNTSHFLIRKSVHHFTINNPELNSDLNIKSINELDHKNNNYYLIDNNSNNYQERIKDKYPGYKHVLYSSYLEAKFNAEFFDCTELKFKKYNSFRKKSFNYKKLLENKTKLPENWLEDYEYYDNSLRTQETNENNEEVDNQKSFQNLDDLKEFDKSRLGNADPTISPSNVPCNGCGAHLHCSYHKKPGIHEYLINLSMKCIYVKMYI